MKNILFVGCLLLTLGALHVYGQEIPYGTGQWNSEGLGNHRAVIHVEKPSDAVRVYVPWRRLDNVEDKNLILIDALTKQRVKNIYCTQKNKDFGEIIFQPVSGEGNYYLYYMPGRNTGKWWFPNAKYEKPTDTYDIGWKNRTIDKIDDLISKTIAFESISDYHSFYPMEIPVTQKELAEILSKHQGEDFLIFPENRNYPIRMMETIPYRWYIKGTDYRFEGTAMKAESYSWQLGLFAAYKALKGVKLNFTDLKTEFGAVISSESIRCINTGGKDHLGHHFEKNVVIPKGEVRSMWVLIDVRKNQDVGIYKGKVEITAEGTKKYQVEVAIEVTDQEAENKGYNTPQNMSRLNWLDSDIGIDDEVIAPYSPIKLSGKTISILGRKLTFNKFGFPAKVTSSFTGSNHSVEGTDKNILSGSIHLDLIQGGKAIKFSAKEPKIIFQSNGIVAWQTVLSSENINILVKAKMECDGYINYETKISAQKDINLENVQLVIPYDRSTAKYLMGMGKQGGYTPEKLKWEWQQEYANNMLWMGDVNAGMQIKLKHLVPDWKLASFEKTGPYRDWSNEGKGGCNVQKTDGSVQVTAYTGNKKMKAGEEMVLNFGLLITPFRILDDKHWKERYYHDPQAPDVNVAIKNGATVMNVHQGNVYNPYINYPFLSANTSKDLITEARAHKIRTKWYYTVRELSTYTCELWALRHLDDEIFSRSNVLLLADTHQKVDDKSIYGMTGHMWLYEHLRSNYDPAWHTTPQSGLDWDMSIRTQGLSRWHNYYIEGLNWLIKNIGIRGLYLDGVGYDREIMKRIRKTMDRAADSCLIDFHSGNNFAPEYGLNSPVNQYMEIFPYVNSIWQGEGYDYKSTKPDYWLVEISGIPLGLYGEMLQECGNPYRGMVYGISSRLAWGGCNPTNIWNLWDNFSISGSEFVGYWDDKNLVRTNNSEVLASVYLKKDKKMIVLGNWADTDQIIRLDIDWKKLGMNPVSAKIEVPNINGLQTAGTADVTNLMIPASKGLILIVSQQ